LRESPGRHALTEIGFYTIVNHGVPSALVHEVYSI
jgi:hypothetical protein